MRTGEMTMKEIQKWILQILYDSQNTPMVVDISEEIGINCFKINGHLSILESMGLVVSQKKSGVVILSLTEKGKEEAEKLYGGVSDEALD